VLTADRPPWLRGTGANQTIDQRELYGRYVRAFYDTWDWTADEVLDAALGPPAGPVQVNLPFDEPLIP
jgi:2-succinyl-5-enolpyruvyl-6-hydroxy-3-cyclohexene-1-carboxylate synthase